MLLYLQIIYDHPHEFILCFILNQSINGDIEEKTVHPHDLKPILQMQFDTLNDYTVVLWSGCLDETKMQLLTHRDGEAGVPLDFHG